MTFDWEVELPNLVALESNNLHIPAAGRLLRGTASDTPGVNTNLVTFQVEDSSHNPVDNVAVRVYTDQALTNLVGGPLYTNLNGITAAFALDGTAAQPVTYWITRERGGYTFINPCSITVPTDDNSVVLPASATYVPDPSNLVPILVTDADGNPITGVAVRIYADARLSNLVAGPAYTDTAGATAAFALPGTVVTPITYWITRLLSGYTFSNPQTIIIPTDNA